MNRTAIIPFVSLRYGMGFLQDNASNIRRMSGGHLRSEGVSDVCSPKVSRYNNCMLLKVKKPLSQPIYHQNLPEDCSMMSLLIEMEGQDVIPETV